jgi:hypothetical protein
MSEASAVLIVVAAQSQVRRVAVKSMKDIRVKRDATIRIVL